MDNNKIQLIGEPVNQHGSYSFYKSFKYLTKDGSYRTISINEFFFVKIWNDSDLVSIGEVQLLWEDKNSDNILSSLRLYFLPENTPDGRIEEHGEDEVMAITEKVVLKAEDLISWIMPDGVEWRWGHQESWSAPSNKEVKTESGSKSTDIAQSVVVLSFPRYCRYRTIARRLEGSPESWMQSALVAALGGVTGLHKETRVLFCKDTFDYPDLEGHELLCNHLAPKLTGRPRKKRKKRSSSPGSESNESEGSSYSTESTNAKVTKRPGRGRPPGSVKLGGARIVNTGVRLASSAANTLEEQEFLHGLYAYMEKQKNPIDRIPSLGFKQIDLYAFYKKVRSLGGYEQVTTRKLWKRIYDEMGGSQSNTSAATCTRKHYERLLLQYEVYLLKKPLANQPRKKSSQSALERVQAMAGTVDKKMVRKLSAQEEIITIEEIPLRRPSSEDSPSLKKRKLEILQQGGLEVTPVGSKHNPNRVTTPPVKREPTAVTNQLNNQVSITVTPDVHHLTVTPDLSLMLGGSESYKQQPSIMQQHHMFSGTGRIYGNPKLDVATDRIRPDLEVLDLTIKPATSVTAKYKPELPPHLMIQNNGHHAYQQQVSRSKAVANAVKLPKANLSSSLEITLVNSAGEKINNTKKSSATSTTSNGSTSSTKNQNHTRLLQQQMQNKNNPYNLQAIHDPAMYYALYNSQIYSQAQATQELYKSLHSTGSHQELLKSLQAPGAQELYKSLLAHPASLPFVACYNQAFPGLPKDGSTSITPLPRPHTSK